MQVQVEQIMHVTALEHPVKHPPSHDSEAQHTPDVQVVLVPHWSLDLHGAPRGRLVAGRSGPNSLPPPPASFGAAS
jgi:hypothetical protein